VRIWSRLGVCAGVLGIAYIILAEVIKRGGSRVPFWIAGWCLAGLGAFLALLCVVLYREELKAFRLAMFPPRKLPQSDSHPEPEEVQVSTKELNRLHGAIIILSLGAMMVVLFPPIESVEAKVGPPETNVVRKQAVTTQAVEAPKPQPRKPAQFPDLVFQGVTLKKGRHSVMVDRRTYFEGDYVHGARILVITPTNVLIEVDGQTKLLALPDF